jgi:hypothetical protein
MHADLSSSYCYKKLLFINLTGFCAREAPMERTMIVSWKIIVFEQRRAEKSQNAVAMLRGKARLHSCSISYIGGTFAEYKLR